MIHEPLLSYGHDEVGVSAGALDGPFMMAGGGWGLLASLRGKDGGALPSPSELHWGRDVPTVLETGPVHVFVPRGDALLYLGVASFVRRGRPSSDGFKALFTLSSPLEEPTWREIVARANAPLARPPEEAVVTLTEASTTDERIAAVRLFAERWHGCRGDALALETANPSPLPLRVLYALADGHELCPQNTLVKPEELLVEDGKVVFYVENQGVCSWATDSAGDDPPVYVRWNEEDAPWARESARLSNFIIQLLIQEAVFGAPFAASQDGLDARELGRLLRRVPKLPMASWETSQTQFFGGEGVVGFAYPEGELFNVCLGAKDKERFEPLEGLLADWPEVSF